MGASNPEEPPGRPTTTPRHTEQRAKTMLKTIVTLLHGTFISSRRIQVLANTISSLLPANAKVLDVGTGTGQIPNLWCETRSDISVQGIDVFVRDHTYIPVRQFDGLTIPYADKSMDVVTFIDVLHHTTDPKSLLIEAKRVARQDVIIKDHLAETGFDHGLLRIMDWVGNSPYGVALPYNYLAKAQWRKLFDEVGLKIKSCDTNIRLYRKPLNLVFGRQLHFVADLEPAYPQGK
jgi:SAM-dependent methyltransferase